MLDRWILLLLGNHLFLSTTGLIIHTQRAKENEEICVQNHAPSVSSNHLLVCHINNNRDRSILIWFKIDRTLFELFHFYRFILRSIDDITHLTNQIQLLTNFTELIDLNNSLRVYNLNSGKYEICLDFQANSTAYVYSPRNGCISIHIGEFLHRSFKQSSTQLFIALISGIILFLLLGVIVQWVKSRQIEAPSPPENKKKSAQERSRSSSILSTVSLTKQRLFRRHFDRPDPSQMRQWARNRAFRHRISTPDNEQSRWSRPSTTAAAQKNCPLNKNDIYIIPMNDPSRKISFYLTPTEEFELL